MKNFRSNFSKNSVLTSCLRLIIVYSWIGTLLIAYQTELLIEVFIGNLVLLFVVYIAINMNKRTPKGNTAVVPQEKYLKQESHEHYLSVFFP